MLLLISLLISCAPDTAPLSITSLYEDCYDDPYCDEVRCSQNDEDGVWICTMIYSECEEE